MKPKDLPNTIYKFRDWNAKFGKNPLQKFELHFSSPSSFNDPFDSKILYNYSLLDEKEKGIYVEKILSNKKLDFNDQGMPIPYEWRIQLINMLMENDNFQSWAESFEIKLIDKIVGIVSCSLDWKNVLMWSHYANNHTGYCIGLRENKFRKSGKISYGGKVMYPTSNSFPNVHPVMDQDESFYKKFFIKSRDWKYEKEYRLLNIIPPHKSDNPQARILSFDSDYIEDVTLGLKISEKDRLEIIDLCVSQGIKVYQAVAKKFEFEVNRIEIST